MYSDNTFQIFISHSVQHKYDYKIIIKEQTYEMKMKHNLINQFNQ